MIVTWLYIFVRLYTYVFTADNTVLQWSYLSFGVRCFRFFSVLRREGEESFSPSSSELQQGKDTNITNTENIKYYVYRLLSN